MPPDLEPASALAERVYMLYGSPRAAKLIEADRAAVREPPERRVAALELDLTQIRDYLPTDWSNETDLGGQAMLAVKAKWDEFRAELEAADERIVGLEGKVRWFEGAQRETGDRIASLETQLASAREEALREVVERVKLAHRMHPSAMTALNFVGEFLASKLPPPAAQKEHTDQSAMASAVESKLALYTTTEPEKEPHGR